MVNSEERVDLIVELMTGIIRIYKSMGMDKEESWDVFMSMAPAGYTPRTREMARTTFETVWDLN